MNETTIKINGMHCGSCVNSIESNLRSLEGIESVKVSLKHNNASIIFDSNRITKEEIETKISQLGYSTNNHKAKKKSKGFLQGLLYGLIPHVGCIAFIIGSILGVTVLMNFFKPLLMNRYFFHALVGISIGFATLSSFLYLRKIGLLSLNGIKRKWKYLSVMYGSTIGINLALFLLIFPMLANVAVASPINDVDVSSAGVADSIIALKVDIPCPGHAPLISQELKTINGVKNIKFSFPNNFEVTYDHILTSKEEIISLNVFGTYEATVVSEAVASQEVSNDQIEQTGQESKVEDNYVSSCSSSCDKTSCSGANSVDSSSTCSGSSGGCGCSNY